MRKGAFLAVLMLVTTPLAGCGYSVFDAAEDMQGGFDGGEAIPTTAKTTANFTKIEAAGPDTIILVTGDAFSIKAEGNAEALKTLQFKVENGVIEVGRKKGKWFGDGAKAATITITAPKISSVSMAGSGNFKGDRLSGEAVAIEIAGSGKADIADVQTASLKAEIAGSGVMQLAGKVAKADYSVAGSGNIDAKSITSETIKAEVAGSGKMQLSASRTVDASIAGSGNIDVTGGAKCKSSVAGSGKLNCG